MKKLLFIGVFSTEHSNNIPQVKEFEKAGWKVDTFDYRLKAQQARRSELLNKAFWALRHPLMPAALRRIFFREPGRVAMAEELIKTAKKAAPNLIFLSKGEEIDYVLLDQLRSFAPLYYYFMDPMSTARFIQADQYAKRSTYASSTFSDVTELFKKSGATAKQIVQGIDKSRYDFPEQKKKYDVIFAGTMDKQRRTFIRYLQDQGIAVQLYGKGTKNGPLHNVALMKEYARSRIILNLAREGQGFSVRVFEAMASGSLLITNYVSDLELFFTRGVHLEWFKTKEECLALIRKHVRDEKLRQSIALKGKEMVIASCTWKQQIRRIVNFIEEKGWS